MPPGVIPADEFGNFYPDSQGNYTAQTQIGMGVLDFAQRALDQLNTAAAQVEGIPAENLKNLVFDLDLREVLGNDNVHALHTAGLPESLMLDIYMSWRTMTKRPPETDADFVQYNAYVHDQLELIYDGMGTAEDDAAGATMDTGKYLDAIVPQVVNLSWMVGSRAEQEIGPLLAAMPNHEFVIDSVRDLPGNSIGMTVTDDPRMCDVEGDPKEMGPIANYGFATPEEALAGTHTDRIMTPATAILNAKPGLYRSGLVDTGAQQTDWSKMSRMEVGVAPAVLDLQPNALDYSQYFQR